ncbi:YfhO family protein [bacterium]|nr:YfhO family protein [bacterium]
MPAWKAAGAALFAALVAVAIAYPGLVAGRQIPISCERFGLSDLTDQNLPLRAWGGAQLARGRLPLWYPGAFGGLPLASLPEAVPYYPPSAVFYMVAGPGTATAWTIVLHLLIAGVGGAMVARHFGAGLGGQLLAAVLMSIGLHLTAHVRQLNIMQAMAWIPWAWLFLDRLLIRPGRRDVAGLGFSMGMLGLAGHPEILHHAAVVFFAWGIIRIGGLCRQWRDWRFWGERTLALGAAGLIGVALALPTVAPICDMMQWIHRSNMRRWPDLRALGMLARPMLMGDPAKGGAGPGTYFGAFVWEESLYIGLLPLALAAGCVFFSVRRWRLWIALFAIGGASLLLAFASSYALTDWIPEMIPKELTSRFPHRYLWGFNMAVTMLAALGFDGLLRLLGRFRWFTPRVAIACVSMVLLVTALDIAWVTRRLNPMGDSSALVSRPQTLDMLEKAGADPDGFAERLSAYGNLPISLTAFDLRPGWSPNPTIDKELHRFLVSEHASIWNWQAVTGYAGMGPFWTGMIMGDQHVLGVLSNLDAHEGVPIESFSPTPEGYIAWSGFLGGRWLVSPIELASPRLRPVGDIPGKYFHAYLYENKSWAGGAWISRSLKTLKNDDWLCVDLEESMPDRDCIRMAKADVPAGVETGSADGAGNDVVERVEWPDPQHVNVSCSLERPGFLVLNQSYYPSWRVRIDGGEPQKPLRVNGCQTGAWLSAGRHRVSFEYPGWRERICILIGLVGFVSVIIVGFGKHGSYGSDA